MKQVLSVYTALVCFVAALASPAVADTQQAGLYKHIVDADFVSQYATVPKKPDVLIIDSRPARK